MEFTLYKNTQYENTKYKSIQYFGILFLKENLDAKCGLPARLPSGTRPIARYIIEYKLWYQHGVPTRLYQNARIFVPVKRALGENIHDMLAAFFVGRAARLQCRPRANWPVRPRSRSAAGRPLAPRKSIVAALLVLRGLGCRH